MSGLRLMIDFGVGDTACMDRVLEVASFLSTSTCLPLNPLQCVAFEPVGSPSYCLLAMVLSRAAMSALTSSTGRSVLA